MPRQPFKVTLALDRKKEEHSLSEIETKIRGPTHLPVSVVSNNFYLRKEKTQILSPLKPGAYILLNLGGHLNQFEHSPFFKLS